VFLASTVIPEFNEKLESDFYQDNTLICLENQYFNPCETSYLITEEDQKSLTLDDKQEFIGSRAKFNN
jgi:hypothetical protein